jgi:hypothetical protein
MNPSERVDVCRGASNESESRELSCNSAVVKVCVKAPYVAPKVERLGSLSKVALFSGGSTFF